jgi:hypothetical protein
VGRQGDECWQHVVLVGNKLVHDVEIKGEGCCPLLVMRFNPTADSPFGVRPADPGPAELRQIDEAELMLRRERRTVAAAADHLSRRQFFATSSRASSPAWPIRSGPARGRGQADLHPAGGNPETTPTRPS